MRASRPIVAALVLAACAAARVAAQAPAPVQASIGAGLEDNVRRGGIELVRMPLTWGFGKGSPRTTLLEIEPSFGWHVNNGAVDQSGLGYTRIRFYHLLPLGGGFSIGPDVETYLKTETDDSLGLGYNRFMPGVQLSYLAPSGWRPILRARYEFSGGEDPGVKSLGRILLRPTVYSPAFGRVSFWARADFAFDLHGAPTTYNVEGLAAVRVGADGRLTVFVEPRVYIGYDSRTSNLWRLRSGLTWSLGELGPHHPEGG